jgi:hypothetical protein
MSSIEEQTIRGWPAPSPVAGEVLLDFGGDLGERKTIKNFSAGSRVGRSLFLAADEYGCIDRLTEVADGRWGNHVRFNLRDLLDLDDAEGEADLEGLAADGEWLWVLGSHARTRNKPEKQEGECIDLKLLADLKETRSRCLLARLPLVDDGTARSDRCARTASGARRCSSRPSTAMRSPRRFGRSAHQAVHAHSGQGRRARHRRRRGVRRSGGAGLTRACDRDARGVGGSERARTGATIRSGCGWRANRSSGCSRWRGSASATSSAAATIC